MPAKTLISTTVNLKGKYCLITRYNWK